MKTAVRASPPLVLVVAVLVPALAAACPLCSEAASNADQAGQNKMWRGMYWSILLMVAVPFAMVGGDDLRGQACGAVAGAALPRPGRAARRSRIRAGARP